MEQASSEFNQRYFRWCIGATLQEVEQGCPRLQLMHTGSSLRYLRYLRKFSAEQRQTFVMALLKQRIFTESLTSEIGGETIGAHEHALCNMYFDHPRPREQEDLRLEKEAEENPRKFKVNRRAFWKVIDEGFRTEGYEFQQEPGESWYHHSLESGSWKVLTQIDLSGRSSQMSYSHRITGPNHYILKGVISLVSWMGFSGGEGIWRYCKESQLDEAADHLVSATTQFLKAAPELLHDLPIEGA